MTIAMSVIFGERSYYRTFSEGTSLRVGNVQGTDLPIRDLSDAFCVTCENAQAVVKMDSGKEIITKLNEFAIIDRDTRLAVYLTAADVSADRMRLPDDCVIGIGRSDKVTSSGERNHVVIDLPFVSATHFKLNRKDGVTTVIDADSRNGLYLNGKLIRSATLQEGDMLSILTARMIFKNNRLYFENVGDRLHLQQIAEPRKFKEAPRNPLNEGSLLYSRSPRLVTHVDAEVIDLEKPPQNNGTPQINWLNVLLTPAITIVLMVVLVVAMGMSATMLLMSGVMSAISAVIAVVNYRAQKAKHKNMDDLIDQKYHAYLQSVSQKLEKAKENQLNAITSANPSPATCLDIAKRRGRQLWERGTMDADFLSVRIGTGTVSAAVTARYQQAQVVINENDLEIEAKQLAESNLVIENAPILCNLADSKQIGVVGNRSDEIQLVRNMVTALTTAHSYDEVKIVVLIPEHELSEWSWIRWLPHCADDSRKERYIFTSLDDAEDTLDTIAEVLGKRAADNEKSYQSGNEEIKPHYLFIIATNRIVEKHPIRKYLLDDAQIGCSALFVYDRMASLPKECNEIIDVVRGRGELYSRHSSAQRTKFDLDSFSLENADVFARKLAPVYVATEGAAAALPTNITFLDGYGVSTPDRLDIGSRWRNAKTYKSLAVPIAAMAGGDLFQFDIHEKRHGVNGIVAGMPGSGKTEMVQTWLLSLAVNYSPQDVAFVLIDFKGTGMIAPFRNLPHLAGSISNLDTNIDRNLVAIRSEVHRREALIDKYSNQNVKNVNDLNKAYEKGLVPERLPILLIVIDEYAEFKKNFPDFGAEIDSLTSKGRALGMFVVLMTQKPAGVVSAKSEDNIKFRWCLRVANYSASREMLGRTDAAKISTPGRAFIKVGEDDVFEQVQSFWSGAPYDPDRQNKRNDGVAISLVQLNGKRRVCEQVAKQATAQSNESEIDVVVRYITEYCRANRIVNAEKVWADKLPERIALTQVLGEGFDGESWPDTSECAPTIGIIDDPESQQQYPLVLDLAKNGHTIIYGAPVTGKTTLLQTLLMSVAMTCSPDKVNLYVMDFGGWNMSVLKDLPHLGGIANDNEPERINKLVILLQDMMEERKIKFSKAGVGNIGAYREATRDRIPDIILAIDNFGPALKMYSDLEAFFVALTGSGANYGIYMVATASASNAVPVRVSQNAKNALALQMIDKSDYTYIVGKTSGKLPAVMGRGFTKGNPPLEFQTALPAPGENDKTISDNIRKIADAMNRKWNGIRPAMIPEMPDVIPYGSIKTSGICLGLSTEKVSPITLDPTKQHYLLISGMAQSGKSELLQVAARQLKQNMGGSLYIFDVKGDNAALSKNFADAYLDNAAQMDVFVENLRPEMQKRHSQKQADPTAEFSPIIIVIDDYSQFFKAVSNDSISRLLAIVKLGMGLGLYLFAACDAYELTALVNKGETVSLSMAKGKCSVVLGGCLNDHAAIQTKAPFAQKSVSVKEREGYFVSNGESVRFKAMSSLGEMMR